MLPKVRRLINNSKLAQSADRLSNSTSSDSNNNLYTQTLLYIVHVDEVESERTETNEKLTRKSSKRTTASFNGQMPVSTPPSFSFSNPFRRLNNLLKATDRSTQSPSTPNLNVTPICTSTTKKSSIFNRSRSQNRRSEEYFPPPPPEFLQPTVRVENLKDGFVDDHCHFDLNAPDVELQKLVIAIDGPSKADIQIEVIDNGLYRVYYKCQLPGIYHISLTYDGAHIDHSPYRLTLLPRPSEEQVVPPTSTVPVRVLVDPMEFYVNTACIVNVRPETPCHVFQAYIQIPQGNMNLPITVHKSAKSENYEIYFKPTSCGTHWLNVNLNHIPMIDNPCRLIVRPFSAGKAMETTQDDLFHAYTGELSQFFVSKSPYDPSTKTGKFSVSISGPSTVFLDANETEYGYEFHYKPNRSGKYLITLKNNGKHIQGSPFTCRVYDINNENRIESYQSLTRSNQLDLEGFRSTMTGSASQVCVFGTGLYEAKKRRKATFKIDASQAGPGLILVGLYSPVGPFERLVIKRIMPNSPGFVYKVSYRVRHRGEYLLSILYGMNMEHVPGSPFVVLVD